jgi:hypothetical protein
VRNETVVYSPGDTTRRIDSLASVAVITYALERGADGTLSLTGTVDSFAVNTGGGAAGGAPSATRQLLPQPLHFNAQLDSSGALRSFTADRVDDCTSPAGALLVAARDLFVALPPRPAVGERWTDSTSSTVCRGDIPVTTKTLQRYEVVQSDSALRVRRTSNITVAGTGTQRGVQVTISGAGNATAELEFDAVRGVFTGSTGDYEAQLQFQAGTATQPFVQRVRQRVVLRR